MGGVKLAPLMSDAVLALEERDQAQPIINWVDIRVETHPLFTPNLIIENGKRRCRFVEAVKANKRWAIHPVHQQCTKWLKSNCDLARHEVDCHSDYRPFPCAILGCAQAFSQEAHLKIHARTHSGEKPSKCVCGFEASDPSSLNRHVKNPPKDKKHLEHGNTSNKPTKTRKHASKADSAYSSSHGGSPQQLALPQFEFAGMRLALAPLTEEEFEGVDGFEAGGLGPVQGYNSAFGQQNFDQILVQAPPEQTQPQELEATSEQVSPNEGYFGLFGMEQHGQAHTGLFANEIQSHDVPFGGVGDTFQGSGFDLQFGQAGDQDQDAISLVERDNFAFPTNEWLDNGYSLFQNQREE